jgi:Zn-dependent peptidase ImmA (M78 family)
MSASIHIHINSEVLLWARNSLALNKTKAAESIGINVARLDKLESGEKSPTMVELRAMAKAYKRTIATLLLKEPPAEKPLPVDRRTINSAQLGSFHPKTILAVRKARALANSLVDLKNETGVSIPVFKHIAQLNDSPRDIADRLRKEWKLDEFRTIEKDSDVLDAYIEHIESKGIAIFQLSLNNDSVRGFSLSDESIPVIVLKRSKEYPSAKIFTLFHELGHILLHEGGICDFSFAKGSPAIEKWCNAFAAEILMPTEALMSLDLATRNKSENSKTWTKAELTEIGKVFHMGPLATLRRLLDNGLTTPEFYESKHIIWNQPTFGISKEHKGRNMPKEIISERGKNYITLAFKAFDQNKIDLKDLSDYLGLKISSIPKARQILFAS